MSSAVAARNYFPANTLSMSEFFSDLIRNLSLFIARKSVMSELIDAARDDLLDKTQELARTLLVLADNPMPISEEAILSTRKNLKWMEEYLDGHEIFLQLSETQKQRLEAAYLDIAEGLSQILIQNAYAKLKNHPQDLWAF